MSIFNQALIAKQGWHFVTNPLSLLSRLFKALYYPNSTFLQPDLGSNPSIYWKGIIWRRLLLAQGLGWKVGDDRNISIKGDNWILGDTHFKLYHP